MRIVLPVLLLLSSFVGAETISISGTVKRANQTPIAGATVWLANQQAFATTDATGAYKITGNSVNIKTGTPLQHANSAPFIKNEVLCFCVLPAAADVRAEVFTLAGRKVATLVSRVLFSGKYRFPLNAVTLPSELYCIRLLIGPTASFFKLPLMGRGPKAAGAFVSGAKSSLAALALVKEAASLDSLIAGCADCIPSGKGINSLSGTYDFTLNNAAYVPPKFIINSAANFTYANCSLGTCGKRVMNIRNFVYLGDSVRYGIDIFDSLSIMVLTGMVGGMPQFSFYPVNLAHSTRYADPASAVRLSLWDQEFPKTPQIKLSYIARQATFKGMSLVVNEIFLGVDYMKFSAYTTELGYLCDGFISLSTVNGDSVNDNTLIYKPFHPVFIFDKDTGYAFVNRYFTHILGIYNPDAINYSTTLLSPPPGLKDTLNSIVWPPVKDAGAFGAKVKLMDDSGFADTLDLQIAILQAEKACVYSDGKNVLFARIDSSKATRNYLFDTYLGNTDTTNTLRQFFNCTADSAMNWYWAWDIPYFYDTGAVYRKATYKSDTISVKSISVDGVTSATMGLPGTPYHYTVLYSSRIGLIYYSTYSLSPGTGINRYLTTYNGMPFDTADIHYLQ